MRVPQSRSPWLSSLFCGALLLTACGGDDDGTADAATDAPEVTDDASEDEDGGSEEDGASDAGASEDGGIAGVAPANGTMVRDGEEFEFTSARRCPPREMFNADGTFDEGEILLDLTATTEDRMQSLRAQERVIDGVTSHRLSDATASIASEYMVEEGEPGFPIFEIDDGVITVDGQTSPAGSEDPTLVTASWDVPDDFLDEDSC